MDTSRRCMPAPNNPAIQLATAPLAVSGLLFDMGDVLYDATVWRRWLLQLITRMGVQASYPELFRVWDADFLEQVHRGQREYHKAFRAFLLAVGLSPGLIDEIEAASQARKRELEASTRPLPGVRSTLTSLYSAGLTLGVLSDSECTSADLRLRLRGMGIGEPFSVVISSRDLGQTKPHPSTYRAALTAMKLRPAQVAFVGHDADELAGAAALGMPTIAFNHEPGVAADVSLSRFDELLQVCVALGSTGRKRAA